MSGSRTSRTPSFHPCKWATCRNHFFSTKEGLLAHLETHFKEPATRIRLPPTIPTTTAPPSTRRNADQVGLPENERPQKQPKVNAKDVAGEKSPAGATTTTLPSTPVRSKTPVRIPGKSTASGRLNSSTTSASTSPVTPTNSERTTAPGSGRSLDRIFTSDTLSRALGSPTPTRGRTKGSKKKSNASVTPSPTSIQALPSPKSHLANAQVRFPPSNINNPDLIPAAAEVIYTSSTTKQPLINAETRYSSATAKDPDSTNSGPKLGTNAEIRHSASTSAGPVPARSSEPTLSGLGILFTPQTLSQIRAHEQTQLSRSQSTRRSRSPDRPAASQENQSEKSTALPTQTEKSTEKGPGTETQHTPQAVQQPSQQNPDSTRNQQDTTNKNPSQVNHDSTAHTGVAQQKPPNDKTTIPAARTPVPNPSPSTNTNGPDSDARQKQQLHMQLMYQRQFVEEQLKESFVRQQKHDILRHMEQQAHNGQQKTPLSTNNSVPGHGTAQNTHPSNIRHNVPPPSSQPSQIQPQVNLTVNTQSTSNLQGATISVVPNATNGNGMTPGFSDACDICHQQADSRVLVCDNCMLPYHESCHKPAPPLNLQIHDMWLCEKCCF